MSTPVATQGRDAAKRPLPEGWRWARLGDVCDVIGGSTPDTNNPLYWSGEIAWVTPTDLGKLSTKTINKTDRYITPVGLDSCSAKMLPANAVIMSSRAPIGHLAIAGIELCTNQGCKGFVPDSGIDSLFLYWTLKNYVRHFQALGSGATFAEISKSALQKFEIPLPPLSEQQRIAGLLDEHMAAVERARQAMEGSLVQVGALKKAFMRELVDVGRVLPQDWHWVTLEAIIKLADSGVWGEADSNEGVSVLRSTNFNNNGTLDFTKLTFRDISPNDRDSKGLRAGDILLERSGGGPSQPVGRVCIFEGDSEPHVFGNFCQRFRVDADVCESAFLFWYLYAFHSTGRTASYQRRTTGIRNLEYRRYIAQSIPLPPLPVQRKIAAKAKERMDTVERAETATHEQIDAINALSASYLRMAFAGKL